ncbi:MAG: methyltransferase domain-containing protein [bacterium]
MLEFSGYLRSVADETDEPVNVHENAPYWLSEIAMPGRVVVEAAPGIFSAIPRPQNSTVLERVPPLSPKYARGGVMNSMFWGAGRKDYRNFCQRALESHSEGVVLDIGGCSLAHVANGYVEECRSVVVIEHSLSALKAAKKKVEKAVGRVPENFVFLQADYRDLPFRDGAFSIVLALGALNTVAAVWELVQHTKRVTSRPGEVYMSALALTGRWLGDRKLESLSRAGKLPKQPWTLFDLSERLARRSSDVEIDVKGNVVYIVMPCQDEPRALGSPEIAA